MSSTDNSCKQFGVRPGLTKCWAWSGSKLLETLIRVNYTLSSDGLVLGRVYSLLFYSAYKLSMPGSRKSDVFHVFLSSTYFKEGRTDASGPIASRGRSIPEFLRKPSYSHLWFSRSGGVSRPPCPTLWIRPLQSINTLLLRWNFKL